MTFPLTIQGTVKVPKGHTHKLSAATILDALGDIFEKERTVYYDVAGHSIEFRVRKIFINTWWSPFGAASSGDIEVSDTQDNIIIRYKLDIKGMFLMSIFLSLFLILPTAISRNVDNYSRALISFIAFIFLYFGSYVFTIVKFPSYLRREIKIRLAT